MSNWNDWKIITLKGKKKKKKIKQTNKQTIMHMRSMCNEASIYIKFRIIVTLIKWNQRDYKKGFLKKKYKKKKR